MRIAITHPTTWPAVLRGTERFLNELARYLAERGHAVTVISAHAGATQITEQGGYVTKCFRRMWNPALGRLGILEAHAFIPTSLTALLRDRFDVVQCCSFTDAYAAAVAKRVTHTPYVFWVNGLPPPIRYYRSLSLGGAVFRRAVLGADTIISFSRYVDDYLHRRFGRRGEFLPIPVDTERFPLHRGPKADAPTILCAAALDDRRKGGHLLMRAFDQLKRHRPDAKLQLCTLMSDETRRDLLALVSPQWRHDVEFLGGRLADLAEVYGRATVSVLPALWEPFGMVLIESLSTGTPVVGANDGGIPEIVTDRAVGRLFDTDPTTMEPTNVDGLVKALLDGLELASDPETAGRCRRHAERYSWSALGPRYESLYRQLVSATAA